MSLSVSVKAGQPHILRLYQGDEPWRDVHVFIFGKKPSVTPETFSKIEYEKARLYALRKLAQKNYSSFELEKSLKNCLVSKETIETLIKEFVEAGYIDDEAWIAQFVGYLVRRKCGPALIRQKLLIKGLERDKAEEVVARLDNQDSLEGVLKLLSSKYKARNLQDFKEKQKVIAALMRKGFDFETINQAFSLVKID